MRIDLELTGVPRLVDEARPAAILEALLKLEESQGERVGWDQPARVFVLWLAVGRATFVEVPPEVWGRDQASYPEQALARYAAAVLPQEAVPELLPSLHPDMPAAVVFMAECWSVARDMLTDVDRQGAGCGGCGSRTFHLSPFRRETRCVTAVGVLLRQYEVVRFRGGDLAWASALPGEAGYGSPCGASPAARLALAARLGLLTAPASG